MLPCAIGENPLTSLKWLDYPSRPAGTPAGASSVFDSKLICPRDRRRANDGRKMNLIASPPGVLGGPVSRAAPRRFACQSRPRPAPPAPRRRAPSATSSPRCDSAAARLTALTEAMRPRARGGRGRRCQPRGPRATREPAAAAGAPRLPHARRAAARGRRRRVAVPGAGDLLRVARRAARRAGGGRRGRAQPRRRPPLPGTVCGVTRQGVGSGRGCQFSYACDGNSDTMKSAARARRAPRSSRR